MPAEKLPGPFSPADVCRAECDRGWQSVTFRIPRTTGPSLISLTLAHPTAVRAARAALLLPSLWLPSVPQGLCTVCSPCRENPLLLSLVLKQTLSPYPGSPRRLAQLVIVFILYPQTCLWPPRCQNEVPRDKDRVCTGHCHRTPVPCRTWHTVNSQ